MMGAVLLAAAMAAAAPLDLDTFFAEFKEKRAGIDVLEAQYVETTILPEDTFTAKGELLYVAPDRIVRRTTDPYEATLLIDGELGYQYEPEVKQVVIYDLEYSPESEILFLGFSNDLGALQEAYDLRVFRTKQQGKQRTGLEVKPRPDLHKDPLFIEATLYLREKDFLPYKIRIQTDPESELILDVSDFVINGGVAPADTQIALAPGTKIVQDNAVMETVGEGGRRIPEPEAPSGNDAGE